MIYNVSHLLLRSADNLVSDESGAASEAVVHLQQLCRIQVALLLKL